jgi:hypothetical protein
VSWDQKFLDPIELPKGKPLVTLRDAMLYITKLPKAEHDAEEWQAAMAALMLVAERDGPTMFARIRVASPSVMAAHSASRRPPRYSGHASRSRRTAYHRLGLRDDRAGLPDGRRDVYGEA